MSSIEEVVSLIEALYSPHLNPSLDVNQIQQTLQTIQKSPDGIHLGNELLSNPNYNANVKYFGALTLTVQLNSESHETKLWEILKITLLHLTKFCNGFVHKPNEFGGNFITIKKLMSNLSLIFIEANSKEEKTTESELKCWENPLSTVVKLLSYGDQINQWNDINDPSIGQIIRESVNCNVSYDELLNFASMSPRYNEILLTITEIIVEDLTKYQTKKHSMVSIHEVVHKHLYVSTLALLSINLTNVQINNINDMTFKTANAWITYISLTRNVSQSGRMDLSDIFQNLINVMCQSNEENDAFSVGEKVLNILANVFSNDASLMNYELRSQIEAIFLGISRSGNADISKNQWMLQYMNHLVTNEMLTELKDLATCMVDFLQFNNLDVCHKLFTTLQGQMNDTMEVSQQYIKILLQMTNFPLVPVLQESFSVRMVDFWLDLADSYTNLASEMLLPNASYIAIEIFQQVVNIYLPKISLINMQKIIQEEGTSEDGSLINEFEDFRGAISDLIQSLWSILGNEHLTDVLIAGVGSADASNITISGSDYSSFFQIESMCFVLNALLVDMSLSESPWIVNILKKNEYFVKNILQLFQTGIQINRNDKVSNSLKLDFTRSSTNLIATLAGYFAAQPSGLATVIETLFQGLDACTVSINTNNTNLNDKLEVMIIKTISAICEKCRAQLTTYLLHFLNIFDKLLKPESNTSSFTRGKLARSIGYIVECKIQDGPEEQGRNVLQFLNLISGYIETCLNQTQQNETQFDYVHNLLDCISEFGSAMIHPNEIEESELLKQLPQFQEFWGNDPFSCRAKVLSLIEKILSNPMYNKNPSFIEVSCLLLGKTLTLPDDEPHFLKYRMSDIINFIISHLNPDNCSSSLPFFTYLLEKMISHYKNQINEQEFDFLFSKIFLDYYPHYIANDPDLLQTMINFVVTVLDSKPSLIIHSQQWINFILPTFVKLLPSHEKFTIVAVTKFWTKVINNRRYSQEELQVSRQHILTMGQELVYQTMYGLYHTQRSDLNSYTDLIRALVAKFPVETKAWLISVLPQLCDQPRAHETFVNKLFLTRGSRAAGSIILNWWLECTNLPSY